MKDAAPYDSWGGTGSQLFVVMNPRPKCEIASDAPCTTLKPIPPSTTALSSAAARVMTYRPRSPSLSKRPRRRPWRAPALIVAAELSNGPLATDLRDRRPVGGEYLLGQRREVQIGAERLSVADRVGEELLHRVCLRRVLRDDRVGERRERVRVGGRCRRIRDRNRVVRRDRLDRVRGCGDGLDRGLLVVARLVLKGGLVE